MRNSPLAFRKPSSESRRGRRFPIGQTIETEPFCREMEGGECYRDVEMGKLLILARETGAGHRYLDKEEESRVMGKYNEARTALKKAAEALEGCQDPTQRQSLEQEMACNKHTIRLMGTIMLESHDGLNQLFAVQLARSRRLRHLTHRDLVQEGRKAIIEKAMPHFEVERGYYFSTYAAWWIRQAMVRAIVDKEKPIRVPVWMHDKERQLECYIKREVARTGTKPSAAQILEATGIDTGRIKALPKVVSIDKRRKVNGEEDGDGLDLFRILADEHNESQYEAVERGQDREAVKRLLGALTAREITVITRRFGLDDGKDETLAKVGRGLGITRERARQIEAKALEKLGRHARRLEIEFNEVGNNDPDY